jgi:hypothetical protein
MVATITFILYPSLSNNNPPKALPKREAKLLALVINA